MNNKALSLIVSYVLLIIIAISISIIVFGALKTMVPKQKPACDEGVSIIIKKFECLPEYKLNITFQNKGLFEVEGVYVRGINGERVFGISPVLNSDVYPINEYTREYNIGGTNQANKGMFIFGKQSIHALSPQKANSNLDEYTQIFDYSAESSVESVKIQPIVFDEETNEPVVCQEAIITQRVDC